jgi:hypothetical protein
MANFIGKLLISNPKDRFGNSEEGIEELYRHKLFRGFNWNDLIELKMIAPFITSNG